MTVSMTGSTDVEISKGAVILLYATVVVPSLVRSYDICNDFGITYPIPPGTVTFEMTETLGTDVLQVCISAAFASAHTVERRQCSNKCRCQYGYGYVFVGGIPCQLGRAHAG